MLTTLKSMFIFHFLLTVSVLCFFAGGGSQSIFRSTVVSGSGIAISGALYDTFGIRMLSSTQADRKCWFTTINVGMAVFDSYSIHTDTA